MTSFLNTYSHGAAFFRDWLADPWRVASVAPSGQALARLMTQEITPAAGPILELGPGTGALTKALLDRGVAEHDLTLIEFGSNFVRMLEVQFPRARVLWMDAARLSRWDLFPEASATAAISGLPLLSMSPRKVVYILLGTFRHLRPCGALYQFTYGPRCPVSRAILNRLGLRATLVGWTVRNFPPAAVYRITRRQPVELARWSSFFPSAGRRDGETNATTSSLKGAGGDHIRGRLTCPCAVNLAAAKI